MERGLRGRGTSLGGIHSFPVSQCSSASEDRDRLIPPLSVCQVYRTALQAKGDAGMGPSQGGSADPGGGEAVGGGRAFLPTGLFPFPSATSGRP